MTFRMCVEKLFTLQSGSTVTSLELHTVVYFSLLLCDFLPLWPFDVNHFFFFILFLPSFFFFYVNESLFFVPVIRRDTVLPTGARPSCKS